MHSSTLHDKTSPRLHSQSSEHSGSSCLYNCNRVKSSSALVNSIHLLFNFVHFIFEYLLLIFYRICAVATLGGKYFIICIINKNALPSFSSLRGYTSLAVPVSPSDKILKLGKIHYIYMYVSKKSSLQKHVHCLVRDGIIT